MIGGSLMVLAHDIEIIEPKALMKKNSVNLMGIINFFEAHEECIYIIDESGRYSWKAVTKESFKRLFKSNEGYILKLDTIAPIVFTLPIEEKNKPLLLKACEVMLDQVPNAKILPIVQKDGRIVAVARVKQKTLHDINWNMVAGVNHGLPQGKLYIASDAGSQLNGLFDVLKDKADVEFMREGTVQGILSGKMVGTLIYGTDVYPDNIKKLSASQLYQKLLAGQVYESNQISLERYKFFYGDFSTQIISEGKLPKQESRCQDFLDQVEADRPIILKDAYDIEELIWMCNRLRSSEKFGSDNRLYLEYSSFPDFLKSMEVIDWSRLIKKGKVVFVFNEEQKVKYYPKTIEKGIVEPLEINEIKEIVNTIQRGYSGSDFFNMILDSHPLLLTIGWHGLPTFAAVWKLFLEGKTVLAAINHMKNPATEEESRLLKINLFEMLKWKYEERLEAFFTGLQKYLKLDKEYSITDWFKAFYLSANDTFGRKFKQRITPAIFYDIHGVNQDQVVSDFGISHREMGSIVEVLLKGFLYRRDVGVVRAPLSRLGCMINSFVKYGPNPFCDSMLEGIKKSCRGDFYGYYLHPNDKRFPISRQFRFEDLKLYPKKTTEKLCEFLRLPWSETCLHITTNGVDSGIVDGTAGFDITPVYKKHQEHLSALDYYRIELLNYNNYTVWGYKTRYYDGEKYTPDELKKLFDIPFKIESQHMSKWPNWPNPHAIREFHDWIYERALDVMEHGEKEPQDAYGYPLQLVKCIYPDLDKGEKLFDCW